MLKISLIDRLKPFLRALRYRNYKLYFFGQIVSWSGTWMQRVAMGWLVYRLTGSTLWLGIIDFCGQIPSLVITPLAGVLSDRIRRYNILFITQSLAMIQAFILAFLTLTGKIEVWHILAMGIFLGMVNSVDVPARHAFLVDIVKNKDDLSNAIALNSSVVNGSRLIGPTIAGFIISGLGEGYCFLINGLSYVAIIVALICMKIPKDKIIITSQNIFEDLKDGFKYAWDCKRLRFTLIIIAVTAFSAIPFVTLMPAIAKDILRGNSKTLGMLFAFYGCGALLGTAYLAIRKHAEGIEKNIPVFGFIFGFGLILLSLVQHLYTAFVMMFIIGLGMIVQLASSNTFLQITTSNKMRGRIMSIYTMAFLGMAPFGSLFMGYLAGKFGIAFVLLMAGVSMFVISTLYFLNLKKMFEISSADRMNITRGVETATNLTKPS